MKKPCVSNSSIPFRPAPRVLLAILVFGLGVRPSDGSPWSWPAADDHAPPSAPFAQRGTATVEFGAQFAAPGAPPNLEHLYGVIHYADNLDPLRDYDLFFSPSLAIWKLWRYEPDHTEHAQYVGGFHADNCLDGNVTATDRVIMPAISTHAGVEAGQPGGDVITLVRSNLGCMNDNYSVPYPIDNYQAAGSSVGVLPQITNGPVWTQATQTLYAESLSVPWLYYDGVLDPTSPRFLGDFASYDASTRAMIQNQMSNALENVRLEYQIRILPDGTVMLTHIWTDLKALPWISSSTDGYWLAPDSAPDGRVFYYDRNTNQYAEPFANGENPDGMYLDSGDGWVGYFVDQPRPDLGLGFYYAESGGISIFPAHYTWGPAVLHSDYRATLPPLGSIFRQTFIVIGTKEEMQAKSATLRDYVYVFTVGDGVERLCSNAMDDDGDGAIDCLDPDCAQSLSCQGQWVCIQPTSEQDGPIYGGSVEQVWPYGYWGNWEGTPCVEVGIHTFPLSISSADIDEAFLRIPQTDNAWTADESALDLDMWTKHIDAADDSQITLADKDSSSLAVIGVYRSPGPYVQGNVRYVEYPVTDLVRGDLDAGRRTFAWRVEPASLPDNSVSLRYFPTVESTDGSFLDNRGARLYLHLVEVNCADDIDNDADGRIDCRDSDCYGTMACGHPDFDGDGDVDQSDFGQLQSCFTGSSTWVGPDCVHADLDGNQHVDGDDLQAFLDCMSGQGVPAAPGCTD